MNGESPVGKRILVERGELAREIIGVVADEQIREPEGGNPASHLSAIPSDQNWARADDAPRPRHERARRNCCRVRAEIQRIDKDMPIFAIQTLANQVNGLLSRERLVASLSSIFGIVALVLAAVGLYGLLAFAAVQRTGEMGLRMALGAERGTASRMVLREAMILVALGTRHWYTGRASSPDAWRRASCRGCSSGLSATDAGTLSGAAILLVRRRRDCGLSVRPSAPRASIRWSH